MAKCSNCGCDISQSTKFCNNCGAKTEEINAPMPNQNTLPDMNGHVKNGMSRQENNVNQTYMQNNMQQSAQMPMQGGYNTAPQQNQPQPQQPQVQYNIPTQPQYQGQAPMPNQYNSMGVATKQKNNKPIIFVGIGIAVVVLLIVLIVGMLSGGGSDDPNVGVWNAQEITMMGMTMDPTDIYPEGITLEIKNSSKCILTLDGESFNSDYEIDGSTFTLTQRGDEFSGTIQGNVITITNLLDMGLDIKFVKEDMSTENSNSANVTLNENDLTGNYMLSSMTTAGVTMNYDAILSAEMEMTLVIDGEQAQLTAYGSASDVELDTSAKTMLLQGLVMDYVIDGDSIVATGDNAGYEIVFVFTAENSPLWSDTSGGGINATGFVPPGYGAEETIPVETLSNPSDWYGILTITDYVGYDDLNGEYEVWGYLGTDDVAPYFELYIGGPWDDENSSVFLSFYIEQHDYTFFPIVGDGSWVLDAPLKEEDNTWFTPSLMSGILVCTYDYDYDGESFTMSYEIAQIDDGTPATGTWNTDTYPDTDTADTQENNAAPAPAPEPETATASFTMNELRDVYLAIQDLSIDEKFSLTYDEVLSRYFNGIGGNITNQTETVTAYQWISIESETSLLNISFEENEDGEYTFRSMSINNIDYE